MRDSKQNGESVSSGLANYMSTAAVVAGGLVAHANADIISSTTPTSADTSTYWEFSGVFMDGGMRFFANPTGVKILNNPGRFAVITTLASGDALSGYSFDVNTTQRLQLFYANTNYNNNISNYSNTNSPTLAEGTHLIGFAYSGDLGRTFEYGWVNYTLTFDADGLESFVLNSWAYNNTADEGIVMGQQQSTSAVPGIGGLAALAMGAAGVRGRRQRVVA